MEVTCLKPSQKSQSKSKTRTKRVLWDQIQKQGRIKVDSAQTRHSWVRWVGKIKSVEQEKSSRGGNEGSKLHSQVRHIHDFSFFSAAIVLVVFTYLGRSLLVSILHFLSADNGVDCHYNCFGNIGDPGSEPLQLLWKYWGPRWPIHYNCFSNIGDPGGEPLQLLW